ncbi:acyl carrier protein [Actinomadura kijaniata]|uniref:acyl carrier protein n=1 Tax=Actinomadura kijaniata TaxID=46161 RepID=UPI003F19A751
MPGPNLTVDDIQALLVAVGADGAVTAADHGRTFEDLDLDSLARFEIATRIQDRFGVNVEDDITAESTPADVLGLVNDRLAAA